MPVVDERARHELFVAVQDTLGHTHADTLMSLLPPVGWADVATKHDLHEVEARLAQRMDSRFEIIDERFTSIEQRLSDMASDTDRRLTAVDRRLEMFDSHVRDQFNIVHDRLDGVQRAIMDQGRSLMFGMIGAMLSMTSLALGAITLLR